MFRIVRGMLVVAPLLTGTSAAAQTLSDMESQSVSGTPATRKQGTITAIGPLVQNLVIEGLIGDQVKEFLSAPGVAALPVGKGILLSIDVAEGLEGSESLHSVEVVGTGTNPVDAAAFGLYSGPRFVNSPSLRTAQRSGFAWCARTEKGWSVGRFYKAEAAALREKARELADKQAALLAPIPPTPAAKPPAPPAQPAVHKNPGRQGGGPGDRGNDGGGRERANDGRDGGPNNKGGAPADRQKQNGRSSLPAGRLG